MIPSTSHQRIFCLLLMAALLASCSKERKSPRRQAPSEHRQDQTSPSQKAYQQIQAELVLAHTEKPYLVLDFAHNKLLINLKAATVWEYPLTFDDGDAAETKKFARRFLGDDENPVRAITERYLFASQGKNPDTLLAIVSGALNVDPSLLQRDVPSRFQIRWDKSLILDVSTNVVAKPKSKFKNTLVDMGQALQRPFGDARLNIKMDPEAAITFWRAIDVGVPTLLRPPP